MPGIASFALSSTAGRSAAAETHVSPTIRDAAMCAARQAVAGIDPLAIDLVLCAAAPALTAHVVRCQIAPRAWAIDISSGGVATQTALKLAADLTKADPNLRRVLIVSAAASDAGCALLVDRDAANNEILATAWIANDTVAAADRAERVSINHLLTAIECATTESGYGLDDIGYLALSPVARDTRDFLVDALELEERQAVCGDPEQPSDVIVSLERGVAENRVRDGSLVVLAAADPPHSWAATCIRWGTRSSAGSAGTMH